MEWLPPQPMAPRLSADAFAHSVKVVDGGFIMESACVSSCFVAWPERIPTSGFCLDIHSKNGVHPHVTLNSPSVDPNRSDYEFLLYLNASTEAHLLLTDSRRNGAAFIITGREKGSVTAEYHCSLRFRDCWVDHGSSGGAGYVSAAPVTKKLSVFIPGKRINFYYSDRSLTATASINYQLPTHEPD